MHKKPFLARFVAFIAILGLLVAVLAPLGVLFASSKFQSQEVQIDATQNE